MATEIRVLAKGDTLVLDAAYAQASGKLRFVGRKLHTADTAAELPEGCVLRERHPVDPGDQFYVEGWQRKAEPSVVPCTGEFGNYFLTQVREGALWPADRASAQLCGVQFDPTFGGDYPQSAPVQGEIVSA